MASIVTLYNKKGIAIAGAEGFAKRGWVLNGFEEAEVEFSVQNEADRLADFTFGNYITIEHASLPIWGGIVDPRQSWSNDGTMRLTAYTAERLLRPTIGGPGTVLRGSAGTIFEQAVGKVAIDMCAFGGSQVLFPGDIYKDAVDRQETLGMSSVLDNITEIATRSGQEWDIQPVVNNGKLSFVANWYKRRGAVRLFAFEEGVNIVARNDVLTVQGDIYNIIHAYGAGMTWADRPKAPVQYDLDSVTKYGARFHGLSVNSPALATVTADAIAFLQKHKEPRNTFRISVMNAQAETSTEETFINCRIGDQNYLKMPEQGYKDGSRGIDTSVRIFGMVFDERKNILELDNDEVIS